MMLPTFCGQVLSCGKVLLMYEGQVASSAPKGESFAIELSPHVANASRKASSAPASLGFVSTRAWPVVVG